MMTPQDLLQRELNLKRARVSELNSEISALVTEIHFCQHDIVGFAKPSAAVDWDRVAKLTVEQRRLVSERDSLKSECTRRQFASELQAHGIVTERQ